MKICLLGDGAVGKTSLVRRYIEDRFSDEYLQTIGTKVSRKVLSWDDHPGLGPTKLNLMIYDVIGQNRFRAMHRHYLAGASGALVVCDVTRRETLDNVPTWVDDLYSQSKDVPLICLGNKIDLKDRAAVSRQDLDSTLEQCPVDLDRVSTGFTSAKTGRGVEAAFRMLGEFMLMGYA